VIEKNFYFAKVKILSALPNHLFKFRGFDKHDFCKRALGGLLGILESCGQKIIFLA